MKRAFALLSTILILVFIPPPALGQEAPPTDVLQTSSGDLTITFIGHGTLMFQHQGKVIHVDPVGREGDYSALPDADLILVTHEHGDHLDPEAIGEITQKGTEVIVSRSCRGRVDGALVMENGETTTAMGLTIEAIPAYNMVHMRSQGEPYHPRGNGNGYIITFGDTRVYVAGDTENIPEMKALKDVDVAFLPMNIPYTMTPEMVADAARALRPLILYPYHFGDTDTGELVALLAREKDIQVRVRDVMR